MFRVCKAVNELTPEPCKIVGAHAADGTIHENYFSIHEGNKSNIIAFKNWIWNTYKINYIIREISSNEWVIEFHCRIISLYLQKIFGFPSGMKQYTVSETEIIKEAPLEFRKFFALRALTFEAWVEIKHHVELCVVSKDFRESIAEILNILNIKFVSNEGGNSNYWRLWSNKLSEEKSK